MKIEKIRTYGWESALMGMRNPKDSWDKSDSAFGIADVEYTDVDYDIAYLWAKNELNETLSYILLSPVFFASVGLNVKLPDLNGEIVIITIALIVVAILTKIIGCGLGAKLCGYNNMESIQIGSGMVTRGEVTLIIASKGLALGLMSSYFLTPVILMVVFTSIFTPILLKIVFSKDKSSVPS